MQVYINQTWEVGSGTIVLSKGSSLLLVVVLHSPTLLSTWSRDVFRIQLLYCDHAPVLYLYIYMCYIYR